MTDPYAQQPPFPQSAHGAFTEQERTWASAAHWGSFLAAWVALGVLAPLIVLLAQGSTSPYVRKHAVESLNFQISLLIYSAAATVVAFVGAVLTLGLGLILIVPVAAVLAIVVIVLIVLAAIAAANGDDYRYPLTLRLVR